MLKAALIFALLLSSTLFSFSQESSPRKAESKAKTTQQDNTKGYSLEHTPTPLPFWFFDKPLAPIVNVYTSKHAHEKSECAEYKDWKEWPLFAWCNSLEWIDTDRVIAIFTTILGIATWFLWGATRHLVKGAEKTAEKQLRAYLGVQTAKIVSHDGGNTFIVEIQIINSGQTPARRVTHSITADIQVLGGAPLDFQMPNTQPGEWFMAPNTSFTFVDDIAIGGASGTGTIDIGQRIIFTWGRVDFIDAFDRPQHIEFRYRNDRPVRQHDGTVMRTIGWELEPSDQGNTCT